MTDTPAPGGSPFPAGNADPVAQPLSAEEETELRRTSSSPPLGMVLKAEDAALLFRRCLATLDAARGSSPLTTQGPRSVPSGRPASGLTDPDNAALREAAWKVLNTWETTGAYEPYLAAIAQLRAALASPEEPR